MAAIENEGDISAVIRRLADTSGERSERKRLEIAVEARLQATENGFPPPVIVWK